MSKKTDSQGLSLSTKDYRKSHLAKGADYDANFSRGGFDKYIAQQQQRILLREIPRLFSGQIGVYLDFACGTGRITQLVEPYAKEPFGIDISESMLQEARRKCARTKFIAGDITRSRIPLEKAELVTAFRFFGNAQHELRRQALLAIKSAIVPNGYLILNNHRNPFRLSALAAKVFRGAEFDSDLSFFNLKRLLEETGFRIVQTHAIGLWIMRNAWFDPRVLESGFAKALEPLSRIPLAAIFSPDAVIIAQSVP
jgi:SAM-dependent methyltransferase